MILYTFGQVKSIPKVYKIFFVFVAFMQFFTKRRIFVIIVLKK